MTLATSTQESAEELMERVVPSPVPGWAMGAFVIVGAGGTIGYLSSDDAKSRTIIYAAIGAFSAIAVFWGVRRNRPTDLLPWYLFAGVPIFAVAGNTVRYWAGGLAHPSDFEVSLPDLVTIPGYLCLIAALLVLLRHRQAPTGSENVVDGVLVAVGAAMLAWSYLIEPAIRITGAPWVLSVIDGTYPPLDVAMLYLAVRLAFTQAIRIPAFRFLALSMVAIFVGDIGWAMLAAGLLSWQTWIFTFEYCVTLLGIGATALHPSMRKLLDPVPGRSTAMQTSRLGAVACPLLVPSVIALGRPLGTTSDKVVFGVGTVVMVALVVWRIWHAVNEDARSRGRLAFSATHDALTGLANRAALDHELAQRLRSEQTRKFAMYFLDLDGFKVINDTLGHSAGDQLLVEVARRLRKFVGPDDPLFRGGGDEFTWIRPDLVSPSVAGELAAQLVERLAEPFLLEVGVVRISASVGITIPDGVHGSRDAEALVRDADTAMYQAKEAGRNRVKIFVPAMRRALTDRYETNAAMRRALEEERFLLHYQPIVSTDDGTVAGFEALIRWQHPERGLLLPGDFVPLAEETGLIVAIGKWAVGQAMRDFAQINSARAESQPPLMMAVNISPRELHDLAVARTLATEIEVNHIDPEHVIIEVTETVMMQDTGTARAALSAIRALGVQISADDFGTGYSSLAYLRSYPLDHVKIDRSFVAGLGHSSNDEAIVEAVIAMARALGLDVTAEGVETALQLDELRRLGCVHAQGFYFSEPLPVAVAATVARSGLTVLDVRSIETDQSIATASPGRPRAGVLAPYSLDRTATKPWSGQ